MPLSSPLERRLRALFCLQQHCKVQQTHEQAHGGQDGRGGGGGGGQGGGGGGMGGQDDLSGRGVWQVDEKGMGEGFGNQAV